MPPIALGPYIKDLGPLKISILSTSDISNAITWSIDDWDRSPISLPSFVNKNLSPENPLKDGLEVIIP